MQKTILWSIICLGSTLFLYQCQLSKEEQTKALYERYCGNCHLTPDPTILTKTLWKQQVLPEMGARLGIQVDGYNPFGKTKMQERLYIKQTQTYPEQPLISDTDWAIIYKYVIDLAPDSIETDLSRVNRSKELTQFKPKPLKLDNFSGSYLTALHYDSLQKSWWAGNLTGEWYTFQAEEKKVVHLFGSSISGFHRLGNESLVLEIGNINPSDIPRGKLWQFGEDKGIVIAENLHRPVFISSLDVEQDGEMEYLVCEYGNRLGKLSLFQKDEEGYSSKSLLQVAGTIRIRLADMNEDGLDDVIVLAAQGDEGIYILFNQGNGQFSVQRPIQLSSIYGSSWFELFDYEGDGDLDIAIVNGDNADYTYSLKPYHGLRLYLNDGNNEFEEAFFYPIYGATRLIAHDFDQDGDIDFAVTAFFPDYRNNPKESFVYLENLQEDQFIFQPFTTNAALEGHWLVMEAGDFEQDGDLDILLGSYIDSPSPIPDSIRLDWMGQNVDLLLLENQTSDGRFADE